MYRPARRLVAPLLAIALLSGVTPLAQVMPGADPPAVAALSYGGWMRFPGLGPAGRDTMSGTVYNWGCRGGTLGLQVYRWGCAGRNNRYLMGHAFAAFEPLHDFVAARGASAGTRALVGMPVYLRTPSGSVERYRVTWARVASVSYWGATGDVWAWNATSAPALTFQTCYGARSEYRIIVRAELLVERHVAASTVHSPPATASPHGPSGAPSEIERRRRPRRAAADRRDGRCEGWAGGRRPAARGRRLRGGRGRCPVTWAEAPGPAARAVVLQEQPAAVRGDDPAGDGEPKPGPVARTRHVPADEPLQDTGSLGLGNAGPVIGHHQLRPAGPPGCHADVDAGSAVLQGVVDEDARAALRSGPGRRARRLPTPR